MSTYTFNLKNPDGSIDPVVITADNFREALAICRRDHRDPYSTEKPLNTDLATKL